MPTWGFPLPPHLLGTSALHHLHQLSRGPPLSWPGLYLRSACSNSVRTESSSQAWSSANTYPPVSGSLGTKEKEYFNNPRGPAPAESEDCLYLNVFAPQSASPTNTKAVLFWLFGGNNQFGGASLSYYNGSSLAVNEDVVVVVINYRTNSGFRNRSLFT